MKIVVLAASSLLVAGCGVPTAAVVVASAVDGVTYLGSGKSITSHTMTAATNRDCSILFGITRGEFCKQAEPLDKFTIKAAGFVMPTDSPAAGHDVTMSGIKGASARKQGAMDTPHSDDKASASAMSRSTPSVGGTSVTEIGSDHNRQQWALVLGSFADHQDAIDLARRVKPEPGLVTPSIVQGKVRFLVSIRPLHRGEDRGHQLNVAALNLQTVKLMPICMVGEQRDTCLPADQSLEVRQSTLP